TPHFTLAPTPATRSLTTERSGSSETATATLTKTGNVPAFFLRLQVTKGKGGDELLPVIWQDNYLSLLPREKRTVTATYSVASLGGKKAALVVTGSNVRP